MNKLYPRDGLYRAALGLFIVILSISVIHLDENRHLRVAAQTNQMVYLPLVGRNSVWQTGTVSGRVIDASSGDLLQDVEICLSQGVCSQTDAEGKYTFIANPGYWLLNAGKTGYYDGSRGGFVLPDTEIKVNFALVPIIAGENIALRIVLTWSEIPTYTNPITPTMPFDNDLDAHLWLDRPDPTLSHHIHYDTPGDCSIYPNACLVSTRTQGSGPETIDISVLEVDSNYYYGVFNYNQGRPGVPPLIETDPHVDIYNQDGMVFSLDPPAEGGEGNFWYVFWIDDVAGVIHIKNCLAFYPAPFELLFSPPCLE